MRVKILKRSFAGAEFAPDVRVLKVGGQSSAGVEKLEFELPAEWQGLSVTLHVQWLDGTLPAPVLLDDEDSVAVDKTLTASPGGQWMLLALGADGYRALTKPTKYECYSTLNTDGDVEISPTQYETFVARVLAYSNSAATSAQEARNSAGAAAKDAKRAEAARTEAVTAAGQAGAAQKAAESGAARAEEAAERADKTAPADGPVKSVNGQGGVVTLTAADVGALEAGSADYVERIELNGQVMTLTMGDGSTRTLQTKDTTALDVMTGVLGVEHGGTGKDTALTAEDVGAYGKNETYAKTEVYNRAETYPKTEVYNQKEADAKFGRPYSLPPATADQLGGVKVGDYLDVDEDGTLSGKTLNDKIAAAVAVKSEPRLVWNTYAKSPERFKTWDVQIPGNVDKICITKGKFSSYGNSTEKSIARGGTTIYNCNNDFTITFQTNGILHVACLSKTMFPLELWIDGYHYPTLADLLTQVTAVESSVTDLQVALCELYEEKEEN